jgi:hypothetical protein
MGLLFHPGDRVVIVDVVSRAQGFYPRGVVISSTMWWCDVALDGGGFIMREPSKIKLEANFGP